MFQRASVCGLALVLAACGGDDDRNPVDSGDSSTDQVRVEGELRFRTPGCCPAAVTTGDIDADGDADIITVRNADAIYGAGGFGQAVTVLPNRSQEGFGPSVDFAVSGLGSAGSIAAGDLNGDGADDLVVSAWCCGATLAILTANGQGGFEKPLELADGTESGGVRSLHVIDIDGDGASDILHVGGEGYSILPNLGAGLFGRPIQLDLEMIAASTAVVGDFDSPLDGRPDIFVVGRFDRVALVKMGEGFEVREILRLDDESLQDEYKGLAAGDFDRDGALEILMSSETGDDVLSLETATRHAAGPRPVDIVAADYNGDGDDDFATANFGDDTVSIVLATGGGGFHVPKRLPAGVDPVSLDVADFDGNGLPDIVVLNDVGQPQVLPDAFPEESFEALSTTGAAYVILNPGM